ncbi:hypothetical protein [Kaistella flava (ex Peng et al. 2021)]|nr:hypothetical protein [Kaistella flava (ex Peng et al. 2021)]
MENPIFEIKKELIKWIKNLDDLETIQKVLDLKNFDEPASLVSDAQSEYSRTDDFDERFAKGLNPENARKESKKIIREWWDK